MWPEILTEQMPRGLQEFANMRQMRVRYWVLRPADFSRAHNTFRSFVSIPAILEDTPPHQTTYGILLGEKGATFDLKTEMDSLFFFFFLF